MAFRIVTKPASILGLVADIRAAADTDKEALGFLPASAYEQAAHKGELTVAVNEGAHGPTYAGHIWISGTFPHARVVQLFVAAPFRSQKLSTRLLRAAIQSAEALGFLSIVANVAADLPANQVYEHHGFAVVRTKPGGQARNRQIHVRVRELSTPTLFNYRPTSSVAVADANAAPGVQPLYLLDLNVFFDATRKRRATPAAEKILAAALNSGVRLAVLTIDKVIEEPLDELWRRYGHYAAISRTAFDAYFAGLDRGAALIIRDVQALKDPVSLQELREGGPFQPPQFYRRVRAGDPEARLSDSELHPVMRLAVG